MLVVDHAVRIDDVHEEFGGRMGADALEVRAEVIADVADLVAGLADRDEELLALGGVTGLLDLGTKLRDELILGGTAAGIELGEHLGGSLGDGIVRIADELRDLHGPELHRGERPGFQGVEHQSGPLGPADEGGEQGGAERAGRLREGGVEELADGSIAAGSQRAGGGDRDGFVRSGERLGERRTHLRIGIAEEDEDAGGGDLSFGRSLGIGAHRQQTTGGDGEFALQAAVVEPERRDRGGGTGDGVILAGEQRAQGRTGGVQRGRRDDATGSQFPDDGDGDGFVRGLRRRGEDEGSVIAIERCGERTREFGACGVSRTAEDAGKHRSRISGGGGRGGGLGPVVGHPDLGGQQERARGRFQRGGPHGTQGGQANTRLGILQGLGVDIGQQLGMAGFGDEEGVLADGGVAIGAKRAKQAVFEAIEPLQGPEGQDAGFGLGIAADHGHERADRGGQEAGLLVHQDAKGVETDDLVRVIEGGDKAGDVGLGEVGNRERRGRLVLDAIDPAEVMLAVRTHGSAGLAVQRAAGVVMRDDRSVEIEDIQRAVRTERDVDGAEPVVHGAEPLALLERDVTEERRAAGRQFLEVDDVEDRLGDEDGVTIFLGPGAVFLDGHGAGGGVIPDLVDLQERSTVRQVGAEHRATRVHGVEGLGGRARGLGQDGLREHDVLDRVAVGRLAVIELHLAGDLVAEAIAALRGDLLDGRAVRLETESAGGEADLAFGIRCGEDLAAAAVAGVDPAVRGQDEVIGDEVGVPRGEAAEQDHFLVGLAVAVRVAEPDDVRLADGDHAVLVMTETRDQLEAFMEDLLLVEDAVVLARGEDADLVLRRTVIAAGDEHAAFPPGLGGERTATIRIFRSLRDPQAAAFVPLDGDGLVDQRLGRDDAGLEARLQLEGGDGLLGAARTADRVTHVHEIFRRAEFVDVRPTGRPGDAALDEGTITGMGERLGFALQEHRGTQAGVLEDPGLRLDVVDGGLVGDFGDLLPIGADLRSEGRSEHLDLLVEIEFEDRLVGDVEGGGILGERMGVGTDIQHHQRPEATTVGGPARAESLLAPGRGRTGDGAAERDETDASVREVGESGAIDDLVRRVVLAIKDDDFVLVVGRREDLPRPIGFGHERAGHLEFGDERLDRFMVVGDDGDLDRGGAEDGGREHQSGAQEGGDAGRHASIKGSRLTPTTLSSTPDRNPTPLKCTLSSETASAFGAEMRGGVAGRLLEGRGETVAIGEADPTGDDGQFIVRLVDQPDGLLDAQVRQMVHRRTADLLEAKTPQMLEAQAGFPRQRLGIPGEVESPMHFVPQPLDPGIASETARETPDVIISEFDPLVVATGHLRAFEFGD